MDNAPHPSPPPSGFLPSGFLPSGFLPSGFLPSGFLPSGFLPSGFLPSGFLPSGFLPSGFLPANPGNLSSFLSSIKNEGTDGNWFLADGFALGVDDGDIIASFLINGERQSHRFLKPKADSAEAAYVHCVWWAAANKSAIQVFGQKQGDGKFDIKGMAFL